MNSITKLISLVALAATVLPCLLYFCGVLDHSTVKMAALIGTVAWFIATPMWMGREVSVAAKEVET